ncbi:flagellin N-terminal helical domain-containing protein [Azospirillum rugosum]|uniref:Flagellin-like hook-associated protein FlgL n=1 Tax=Azospirillum rugosum TaxID=416170 RepID=A0ABS4SNC0_9PROT|nr:flagellin [Azospirillum rugosum]MBP2294054.1 flagellin-like hook-associated protein FlgL [Azospirillum rugosum]MDQ0527557.1 flagellin-like hook-associated protein FlgL [Azospirillum rugosum]
MAINDVTLTASMRTNLLQLQSVQDQIGKKQNILSTGNKINSALDGPTSFFAAKGLNQRAGDLSSLKDAMGQSISTIKAADKGVTAINDMIEQARGLTTAAYSALGTDAGSMATRKALAAQFNALKDQIDKLAGDSGYAGKNLLAGNGLRMDSTSASRQAVNTIQGIENARVTNVVSADTYTVRIKGDGSIEAAAGDINNAEMAHGLVGLKLSGTMSTTMGSFSDVQIEVRGAVGRERSFIVSDGTESRTVKYFDNSQTIAANMTRASTSGTAQVTNVQLGGTIEAGDIFTITIEDQTFSYTATASDVAVGSNARANVASALRNSISTAIAGTGRLSTSDAKTVTVSTNGTITLTGATSPNSTREMSVKASTENALTKRISESFASGTVVSFTVDRKLLEQSANGGNGISVLEKKVDIQIQVSNLNGATVTRDGMANRGEGKLSQGENSFAFDTGTVRFNVDQNKIKQAASANSAANLVTVQVTDANTSNDLTVQLNERNTNSITVKAQNLTTSGQGLRLDYAQNDWTDRSDIDKAVASLDYAKSNVRSASQTLSTNLNIITTRETFTKEFSDVLVEGANKLTLADQNEEGASLLMLQTRQQLGTIALSLANQSQQSILRLF